LEEEPPSGEKNGNRSKEERKKGAKLTKGKIQSLRDSEEVGKKGKSGGYLQRTRKDASSQSFEPQVESKRSVNKKCSAS